MIAHGFNRLADRLDHLLSTILPQKPTLLGVNTCSGPAGYMMLCSRAITSGAASGSAAGTTVRHQPLEQFGRDASLAATWVDHERQDHVVAINRLSVAHALVSANKTCP